MRRSFGSSICTLVALLAACADSHKAPEPTPVIVRDNTRVLGADGRALLASFDLSTGALAFSGTTPQLAALKAGDILASEPTPAAPYGLLRKIVSVTPQGAGLALATTPGSLREAIVQGDLAAQGHLSPSDLTAFAPAQPGILARPESIGFDVPYSLVLHDGDGNLSTTGDQLRLTGSAGFDIGYSVSMGFKASYDPPFDVDLSTKFIAILYIQQHAGIGFESTGAVDFAHEVPLGTYSFTPITFFVGPVPVVLVPTVTVSAEASGHMGAKLSFGADETLTIQAGVSKDYGQGFKPVFDVIPAATATAPTLVATYPAPGFSMHGGVKARGSLRLYGLVGPFAELEADAYLLGGIGNAPPWQIRGGITGRVGVEVDLLFWEYDWSQDILGKYWDIAQATGNTAPVMGNITPAQGTAVQLGQPIELFAVAGDVEDGWFCCTKSWTSDKEGALGTESSGMKHVFQVPGTHTLTVVATDSGGAHAVGTTTIQVLDTPPVVTLAKPAPGFTWYRGVSLLLDGWATDGNQSCATLALHWSSSAGDAMPAASCANAVKATFATNGTRNLTLTAVDDQGKSDAKTVSITIVDPPANIPPDVAIVEPAPGASILDYQTFTVTADIFDADNAALTYSLSVSNAFGVKQLASGSVPGNATLGTTLSLSFGAQGNLLCGVNAPNTLELRVADGTGGHLVSAAVAVTCTVVPK
jgi:hypothetical protein